MLAVCCRFDFSGNGESEGRFRYGNYNEEVHSSLQRIEIKLAYVCLFKTQKYAAHAVVVTF